MSRVLFLCSGNTCRSPMAAGVARRIFGPSHTIQSAGAETGDGLPAARNAIIAMSELDVDISNHKTIDVAGLNLADFDLVVVFRPSAAESMAFPKTVRVSYFDIPDPYGGTIDNYRAVAIIIQRRVRRLYVEDALFRMPEKTTGSHVAGVFNRAAKEFEKEVADFARGRLGLHLHAKATLGQLGEAIAAQNLAELMPLCAAIAAVNDTWAKVKHHDDPAPTDLMNSLTSIQRGFRLLDEQIA